MPGGRPRSGNPRRNTVAVRFTDEEIALMEEFKGSLSKGEFLRLLFVKERRRRASRAGGSVGEVTMVAITEPDIDW